VTGGWLRPALAAALTIASAACGTGSADGPAGKDAPPRCAPPLVVPDGFEVTGGLEDPHDDRIGVRIDLVDADRRELHYFSGIRGEFGEGLPGHDRLDLGGGVSGVLLGRDTTWVLQWETPAPCTPTVVIGNGMPRRAFEDLVRSAGAFSGAATASPTPA
jgi:hypothetical protein